MPYWQTRHSRRWSSGRVVSRLTYYELSDCKEPVRLPPMTDETEAVSWWSTSVELLNLHLAHRYIKYKYIRSRYVFLQSKQVRFERKIAVRASVE